MFRSRKVQKDNFWNEVEKSMSIFCGFVWFFNKDNTTQYLDEERFWLDIVMYLLWIL